MTTYAHMYCMQLHTCMYHAHTRNTHTCIEFATCIDAPSIDDSCYGSETGAISWSPFESCGIVDMYDVQYTRNLCNESNTTVEIAQQRNTFIFLTSSEIYCIRVRAVINENYSSSYSTCAQVSSQEGSM